VTVTPPDLPPATFALRVGVLIDGRGGPPAPDVLVQVDDGRIAAVGPAGGMRPPPGVPTLDFSRHWALPGLIDVHAHPTFPSDRRDLEAALAEPDEMLALTAVRQLGLHLRSGVTTVRDCGARGRVMFHVREAIRRGYVAGPRLELAGRPVTHSRGHLHALCGVADTADEIRRAVRVLVAEGADVVKVVASGGGTRGGIPYLASYGVEELRIAVSAAHALERRTVAHARATASIENCVDAGVDAIAHVEFLAPGAILDMGGAGAPTGLPRLDPRVAEKLARSSAFLDLNPQSSGWDTLRLLRQKAKDEAPSAAERVQLESLERYFDHFLPVIRALRDLGLADRMAFGSDAGPFDTEFGHLEYNVHLARLAGLSPMESLQAVTRNAARLIGWDARVGTVEAGKAADLLVLDADPLADAEHLTRVAAVFQAGARVR
jgi:imidazolonepropionase-like amidohydrolase